MNMYLYRNTEIQLHPVSPITLTKRPKRSSILFRTYFEDISRKKEEIDSLENTEMWDKMKKLGNPYELIYTTYHRKRKNESISSYSPLSRSYFKMWEIYNNYPIFKNFPLTTDFQFCHLAEGPGGFMEASFNYLKHIRHKRHRPMDRYYGITLKPYNDYIPDWTKIQRIFGSSDHVYVQYGNLYLYEEVLEYVRNFSTRRAHVVTADGGFDYSKDFNGQELSSCQIIFSEMVIAFHVLIRNGSFICKVFDLFSVPMMKMIELLHRNFEFVYIYKPSTSRPANSEKYIVCLNYLDIMTPEEKLHLLQMIGMWNTMVEQGVEDDMIVDFEGIRVKNDLIHSLERLNEEYIQQQKSSLEKILDIAKKHPSAMIDKVEYDQLIRDQVSHAIEWCTRYNIEINQESCYYRKFHSNRGS
jgi:cap1 methyltransferase